ncbi:unnamed protein product [Rangifer tarandus platyrhynchus]|uniref:Uncharacterized protein n=2 Tax=Rangifer tarandus platyrhynchus TaxID=3082113 RepID=A0ABN8ZIX1_RANTA|nr:unnamed protein product [Rangifer tarandus platyrhynchus]CAI9708361.1 unnamed protein product [Rangifer tarandus platyrhynchus]
MWSFLVLDLQRPRPRCPGPALRLGTAALPCSPAGLPRGPEERRCGDSEAVTPRACGEGPHPESLQTFLRTRGTGHSCRLLSPSPSAELRIALPGPGGALGTICQQGGADCEQALPVLALNVGRGVEGVGGPFPGDSVGNLLL